MPFTTYHYPPTSTMPTMSSLSLNTKVHVVGKSGAKTTKTVRDIRALGSGSTYDCLQMMDGWDKLVEDYYHEVFHPLNAIQDKVDEAVRALNKAKYWKNHGLYQAYASPTEKDMIDAQVDYLRALTARTILGTEQFRLKKKVAAEGVEAAAAEQAAVAAEATAEAEKALYLQQEQRVQKIFSETAPPLFMPAGLDTIWVRGFQMPTSLWTSSDTVTVSCNHAVNNHPNPVLTYPKGTKLRVFYMVPDVETRFWCKAVVTKDGCFQYSPTRLAFASTCDWLMSLPHLYLATMSITLP